jgi:hypothetical protein
MCTSTWMCTHIVNLSIVTCVHIYLHECTCIILTYYVLWQVYDRLQSGEYKVEDGWDGVKTGFSRAAGYDPTLVEAEAAKSGCC